MSLSSKTALNQNSQEDEKKCLKDKKEMVFKN
jgi:hypothetical protein